MAALMVWTERSQGRAACHPCLRTLRRGIDWYGVPVPPFNAGVNDIAAVAAQVAGDDMPLQGAFLSGKGCEGPTDAAGIQERPTVSRGRQPMSDSPLLPRRLRLDVDAQRLVVSSCQGSPITTLILASPGARARNSTVVGGDIGDTTRLFVPITADTNGPTSWSTLKQPAGCRRRTRGRSGYSPS